MDKTETRELLTERGDLRVTIADATATGSYIDAYAEIEHRFGVPREPTAFATVVLDKEIIRSAYIDHNGMPKQVEVEVKTDSGVLARFEDCVFTQPALFVKDQRGYEYEFASPDFDVKSPYD